MKCEYLLYSPKVSIEWCIISVLCLGFYTHWLPLQRRLPVVGIKRCLLYVFTSLLNYERLPSLITEHELVLFICGPASISFILTNILAENQSCLGSPTNWISCLNRKSRIRGMFFLLSRACTNVTSSCGFCHFGC